MSIDLLTLVVAITLSHISMLLILGRTEELYRGLDRLTSFLAGSPVAEATEYPTHPDASYLGGGGYHATGYPAAGHSGGMSYPMPYPMYDDRTIPEAVPAGGSGAPLDFGPRPAKRTPAPDKAMFTNNYYL